MYHIINYVLSVKAAKKENINKRVFLIFVNQRIVVKLILKEPRIPNCYYL